MFFLVQCCYFVNILKAMCFFSIISLEFGTCLEVMISSVVQPKNKIVVNLTIKQTDSV